MKLKSILGAGVIMLALTSCYIDNLSDEYDETVKVIRVVGPDDIVFEEPETRGTQIINGSTLRFSWAKDDSLGIFPNKGNQVEFPITSTDEGTSAVFDGGGWGLKEGASYAAYYPFSVWNYHRDSQTILIDYSGQIQDGNGNFTHLSAYDYLSSPRVTQIGGTVTFQMSRLGAILFIDIVVPEPTTVNSLVISCNEEIFTEKAELDISGEEPVLTAKKKTKSLTLEFINTITTEANETVRGYMAVSPVDFREIPVFATLYTDDGILGAPVISREIKQGKAASLKFADNFTSSNVLYYTSNNQSVITPSNSDAFGANIISNSYSEGVGIIEFDKGVAVIGQNAFINCNNLTSIIIPEGCEEISEKAFSGCSSLSSIDIPKSIIKIGKEAFESCNALQEVNISDLKAWCSIEFSSTSEDTSSNPLSLAGHLFLNGNEVTTLIIDDQGISDYAFSGCLGLTSISYTNNTELSPLMRTRSINQEEMSRSIGYSSFRNCVNLTSIVIPEGITVIGSNAFNGCTSLSEVSLPTSLTSIETAAFSGCRSLKGLILPENLTRISSFAFSGCGLTEIDIPDNVSIPDSYYSPNLGIAGGIFENCESLVRISLPSNMSRIPERMFFGCASLKSIDIPEGCTAIDDSAFENCIALESVSLHEGLTEIWRRSFYGCVCLHSIDIPSTTNLINTYAFYECDALTDIILPDSVTELRDYAFFGCDNLESITLSNGLARIQNYTFSGCLKLNNVMIPQSVTYIAPYAFNNCKSLTSISLSDGLTGIGNYVFSGCSALDHIVIPSTVTSIGSSVFLGCPKLANLILLAETPPSLGSIQLNNAAPTDFRIFVPINSVDSYKEANRWKNFSNIILPLSESDQPILFQDSNVESICVLNFDNNGDGKLSYNEASLVTGNQLIGLFASNKSITSFNEFQFFTGVTRLYTGSDEEGCFDSCSSLKTIVLPCTLTRIGDYAFYQNIALTTITIPASVTAIEEFAFYDCSSLSKVYVESLTPPSLDKKAFDRNAPGRIIYVPNGTSASYTAALGWSDYASSIIEL